MRIHTGNEDFSYYRDSMRHIDSITTRSIKPFSLRSEKNGGQIDRWTEILQLFVSEEIRLY